MINIYVTSNLNEETNEEIRKYRVADIHKSFIFRNDKNKISFTHDKTQADALLVKDYPEEVPPQEFYKYLGTFPRLKEIINVGRLFHVDEWFNYESEEGRYIHLLEGTNLKYHQIHPDPLQKNTGVFYDYSFNIVKYGFSSTKEQLSQDGFDHILNQDPRMYYLGDIRMGDNKKDWRTFLSPNRVFDQHPHSRNTVRRAVTHFMSTSSSYYTDNLKNQWLPSQFTDQNTGDLLFSGAAGFWFPVHDWYYRNTFISCPVESGIKNEGCLIVTEKTWIPFIKGHFVMPFGVQGLVSYLQENYGIKLPNWIDYSYDDVSNPLDRLTCYLECLNKLNKIPHNHLYTLWERDKDILAYNRELIINSPPQSGYDSIKWKTLK